MEIANLIQSVQDRKFTEFSSGIKSTLSSMRDEHSGYKIYSQEKSIYNTAIQNAKDLKSQH